MGGGAAGDTPSQAQVGGRDHTLALKTSCDTCSHEPTFPEGSA